ncbi:MAG: hypothetical protein K0B15_00215 [Lentimicrobium sp.]|nr:hypothetical protein [Lentimicrobium sp.]
MKLHYCFFILFAFLAQLVNSCKEADNHATPPVISINTPYPKQIFSYGDTIFVKAGISHFRNIVTIKVSLMNNLYSPVLPVLNFEVNNVDFQLNAYIVLDEIRLKNGNYFLQIKVSDQEYSWNEWVDIQIIEAERKLVSLIAVTQKQFNQFQVFELPSDAGFSELFSFQGDFLGSALNPIRNLLYIAGSVYSGLVAWDLNKKILIWNIPAVLNPPQPWYYGLYFGNNDVFVSNREGYINGYDNDGNASFRSQKFENGIFKKFIRHQSKLISVLEPFNQQFTEMVVFNFPGGTVFRSMQITGQVVHLSHFSDKSVMVFVNEPMSAAVYEYSIDEHTLVKLKTFPFESMESVINSENEHFFILSGNEIWWYRPDLSSATHFLTVPTPVILAFDDLDNYLFVAFGKNITTYRLPFSHPVQNHELPYEIVSLNLRYNK